MSFNVREVNLDKLNSMTKYPSIFTYHNLGEKGKLLDTVQIPFPTGQKIPITEKIDGTNARMIFTPDNQCIIGSREDLLWATGDLIGNHSMGIVSALKWPAETINKQDRMIKDRDNKIYVVYLEVYGKGVGAGAKNYSKTQVSYRVFDIAVIDNYESILSMEREEIAHWRDNKGQSFVDHYFVHAWSTMNGVPEVPLVECLQEYETFPVTLSDTYEYLKKFKNSKVVIDESGFGRSEGIVIRSDDRSSIAKIRFEDYKKTLGIK